MSAAEEIFEAMRRSGMNDWVGGGDPGEIASENFAFDPTITNPNKLN